MPVSNKTKKEDRIMPENSITSDIPRQTSNAALIPTVIILSLIFGMIGSIIGAKYLLPFYQDNQTNQNRGVQTIQVNEQSAVIDVVKRAGPAVVSIVVSQDLNSVPGFSSSPFDFGPFSFDPFFQSRGQDTDSGPNIQQVGAGSGFFVQSNGLIVTNKHVVDDEDAIYTVITNDGSSHEAEVLSVDPVNDLALIKIEGEDFPTLTLGDSSDLEIGQRVIAIGNSLGQYSNTVTTGVVSGIGRTIVASTTTNAEQLEGVIQTDAAINPGNSGGPLLDIGGSVIGINTAIDAQGQLVGFAIPSMDIKKDIDSFQKFGAIVKPFLGVRYVLVNQTIMEENELSVDYGALIIAGETASSPGVVPGSAADEAGIAEGDVILEVNGQVINQQHSLAGTLKNFDPGDIVRMKILSDGAEREVSVTLGETR